MLTLLQAFLMGLLFGIIITLAVGFIVYILHTQTEEDKWRENLYKKSSNPTAHYIGNDPDEK